MKTKHHATCLLILLLAGAMPAQPTASTGAVVTPAPGGIIDDSDEYRRVAAECRDWLVQRRFAELEARGQEWNRTQARNHSGSWLLESFFQYMAPTDSPADETVWQNYAKLHKSWKASLSQPSAVQLVAEAKFWFAYAGTVGGIARTQPPPPDMSKRMEEYRTRAETLLRDNWTLAATVPTAHATMAAIARVREWPRDQWEALCAEGVRRHPEYFPLYFAQGTLLQWSGAPGELVRWAWTVTEGRPDDFRHEIYARIAWSKAGMNQSAFALGGFEWPKVRAGFEVLRAKWPQSGHILNRYARFAWQAGDPETARQLLPLIGDHPSMGTWRTQETYDGFRQWVRGGGQSR